ncbi:MAG: phosphoethanolamine--lipid A transferase [Telluria sp.]
MRINFPFRVNANVLPLAASLYLIAVFNLTFWRNFVGATGGWHWAGAPVQAGMFVLLVAVFTACLALINFRHVLKPVLIGLCLTTSVVSYFINQYGTLIDWSMVQNILETDQREGFELLSMRMLATVALTGAIPAALIAMVHLDFRAGRRQLAINLGTAACALTLAALLLMLLFKSLAPALHEHRELRFLLTPTNYLQAVSAYYRRKWSTPVPVAPLGTDAAKGTLWAGTQRRTVTVIVVGETARAANFSLNGYARRTNPQLEKVDGLINFSDMQSCGTATAVSLPCLFSALGRERYTERRAHSQQGLLDVIRHAGIDVVWRDNNSGCKGVCDRVAFEDVSRPVKDDPLCNEEECFDEILLRGLRERIAQATGDLVIVLHQKGSHGPAYARRYPAAFQVFGPVCETGELNKCTQASIVAAYDNTILYTDHVLKSAIDLLERSSREDGVDTSLMYFSDHGESLGENNLYLHGAPYMLSPVAQRHVPFMVWLSDGFRSRFRLDRRCLEARAAQKFDHDYIFHSVLGMLNISTAVHKPQLDLFAACRNAS